MKTYGQFCPLAQATQLLCKQWTLLVIREMIAGSKRFSELQKGVPLMSPTLLSTRLKQLAKAGVIAHHGASGSREYTLTRAGLELHPVVLLLGAWGHRWVPSKLGRDDLDASLLMWDMRRTVDPAVFPKRRIVIQFEYTGEPVAAKNWWLVSENGEVDLCLHDNGYDIDVVIKCSLKTMTAVWTCQRLFTEAVKQCDIKVLGDAALTRKLPAWLRASTLSELGARERSPEINWAPTATN